MTTPTGPRPDKSARSGQKISVEEFLRSARLSGVLDEASYQRLVVHYVSLSSTKPSTPMARTKTRPAPPPAPVPEPKIEPISEGMQRRATGIESDLRGIALADDLPRHVRERARALYGQAKHAETTDDFSRALTEASAFIGGVHRSRPTAPAQPPAPVPQGPKEPGPLLATLATIRESMTRAWKQVSADFAANTLTYIGVLLAVVVIFVFFAFGYVGEVVANPNLRPLVEIAVPLFFFGLAWVLRNRTGLPAAASAVGLIGAVTLPVMLSASFQDGSLCCPPDVNGPPRWAVYGVVGLIAAAIYLWLSTRARIYSYLVVPMLWAGAGALGLYWKGGMSGPQIFTVLGAIAISLLAAAVFRDTSIGKRLAVPTVRAGVLAAPFVLIVGLVFAYNDAVESGVADPRLADLAYPGIVAALLTAAVFALSSGTAYAWAGIPVRTRTSLLAGLRSLAYITLAGAWLLTAGLGIPTGWLGFGLVGYAIAVIVIDRMVGGTGTAAAWIARVSGAAGLLLALADPIPATLAWAGVAAVAALRAVSPPARRVTAGLVPTPTTEVLWVAELWVPALTTVAIVAGQLVPVDTTPWALAAASVGAAAARYVPHAFRQLRSYATAPALLLIAAGAATTVALWSTKAWSEVWSSQTWSADLWTVEIAGSRMAEAGAVFIVLAGASALAMVPWRVRLPLVAGFATVGAGWAAASFIDPGPWGGTMLATAMIAGAGTVLVVASMVPHWRMAAYAHGLLGHLYLYGALVVGVRFEETAILALSVIIVTHATEALLVERRDVPFVSDVAALAGSDARLVTAIPGSVAAIALIPWAVLVSLQVPWVSADVGRLALVFAALSWMYAAAAAVRLRRFGLVFTLLSYALAGAALAAAVTSQPALVLATASGAGVTMWLAITLRVPYASVPSWVLGGSAFLLGAVEAGVDAGDLHFWLLALSTLVLVAASTVNLVTDGYPGVRSRWLQPPLGLALVSVAAMIAVAAVDGRWVWLQAILAAGALVWLGWCVRYAGVAFLVAAFAGVAYVDVLAQWVSPLEEPIYLMPYAFAVLAVTVPMPGRHTWQFLTSAYPGTLLVGLITVVLAVSLGTGTGDLAPVLAWSAVWFAAVFALRREDPWLYVSLASLVAAGWIAGFGWAAVANATAAATAALLADVRRDRISGEILSWVATGFLAAACGAFVQWQSWPPNTFVVVSIALGAALAGAAVVMWLVPDLDARWRRWKGPVTVLGQGALFTAAVVAGVAFDRPKASGVFGSILFIEAILLGSFATVRLDRSLAWASAVMVAFSAWLLSEASSARPERLVIGAVAIAAVLTATWAALFSSQPNAARVRMWTHPMLALAAAASVAAAALASAEIPPRSAAVAVAAMLTWHALVVGAAGTTRLDRFSVWAASAIATAAYGFWLRALEPSPAETVAMLAATAAFTGALGAWLMLRPPRFDPARLWIGSLNAWAGLSALAAIVVAYVTLPAQSASLIAAALSFGCAALLALHTRGDRSASLLPEASAAALIASVAFLVAGIDPESALFVTGLILLAATGAAAAIIGVGLQGIWQRPTFLVAVGFEIVTVTAAATLIGPTSEVTGYVLALAGAALAGYGIVGRDLRAVEAAIVTWAVSALILLNGRITLELHSIVLTISVATLAALEIERHRLRAEGREAPAGVGALEWALMAAPMTLAVVDAFGDLSYAVLLAAEGIALLVWGTVAQTRRRAFAGIGGIVTAIALAVVIPVVEGVRRGLAGETWLIIGAVAAVVLIAAGSMIEKRRERIGRRLAHVVEIVEGWQ